MRHAAARLVLTAAMIVGVSFAGPGLAASSSATPQAFMDSFYAHFRDHHMPEIDAKNAAQFLTPALAALQREYERQIQAGQDEDPQSEGDGNDFCGCQDTNHPTWKVEVNSQTATTAETTGYLTDEGKTTTVHFHLERTPAGWRIGDYKVSGAGESLKRQRQDEIKANAKHKPGTYS